MVEPERQRVTVDGLAVDVVSGGSGPSVVVLHHDIGNPGWLPFYDRLAERYRVVVPSHPGFDTSERPAWLRSVRELASLYQWLFHEQGLDGARLVGLGFGAWIAAEVATTAHGRLPAMALLNPMGLQPREGEICDQFLVNAEEYVSSGFVDIGAYHATFGEPPSEDQLVTWEVNREMTTRIAWKPYMFDRSLEHLLHGVDTPTLVVAGTGDKLVPPVCAEQYAELVPGASLRRVEGAGHFVEIERPDELAGLVSGFFAEQEG
ncbi:MAG: alpha/beta fold hydrolase [Acidimicrobiia bacterium]|nr:alpha/beta fold hydrolase [Acidimicrobiia bacterium]